MLTVAVAGCSAGNMDEPTLSDSEQPTLTMDPVEYDSSCMVFFPQGTATVDDVVTQLDDYAVNVRQEGDTLYVNGAPDCQFRIQLVADSHVLEEAIEIGTGSPHEEKMRTCNARFEIAIENLDVALGEFNTLMEVQSAVQDATQGLLFLPWNGELTEPWKG